jgi:hypothetical protein
MSSVRWPDDNPAVEQWTVEQVEAASPSEIAEALAKGQLQDVIASGELGQKAMAQKSREAYLKDQA